jgi:hypothetical protein
MALLFSHRFPYSFNIEFTRQEMQDIRKSNETNKCRYQTKPAVFISKLDSLHFEWSQNRVKSQHINWTYLVIWITEKYFDIGSYAIFDMLMLVTRLRARVLIVHWNRKEIIWFNLSVWKNTIRRYRIFRCLWALLWWIDSLDLSIVWYQIANLAA